MNGLVRIAALAAGVVAGAAIGREMDKPADQREWHGDVGGVPYDFRPPTTERIKQSVWDPENPNLVTPMAFGVGWSVNLARVAAAVQPPDRAETVSPPSH